MKNIRRYSNRKLYDIDKSTYVTLKELAEAIRAGEDIVVTEKESGRNITDVTLAQMLYEEVKRGRHVATPLLVDLLRWVPVDKKTETE